MTTARLVRPRGCGPAAGAMDALSFVQSWFPSLEELEAHARRRREERGGWVFEPAPVDPASVIVSVEECNN